MTDEALPMLPPEVREAVADFADALETYIRVRRPDYRSRWNRPADVACLVHTRSVLGAYTRKLSQQIEELTRDGGCGGALDARLLRQIERNIAA